MEINSLRKHLDVAERVCACYLWILNIYTSYVWRLDHAILQLVGWVCLVVFLKQCASTFKAIKSAGVEHRPTPMCAHQALGHPSTGGNSCEGVTRGSQGGHKGVTTLVHFGPHGEVTRPRSYPPTQYACAT
eukprot:72491-Prorocentrum_minimum.AAC.9